MKSASAIPPPGKAPRRLMRGARAPSARRDAEAKPAATAPAPRSNADLAHPEALRRPGHPRPRASAAAAPATMCRICTPLLFLACEANAAMGAAPNQTQAKKRGLKMKTTIKAIALATAFAVPMAAVTATPAASWGVVTKWWESNKEKSFWKGLRSKDCWREGASMQIYDSGNEIC